MNLYRHIPTWLIAWGLSLIALLIALSFAGSQPAHAEHEGPYAGAGAGFGRLGNAETNDFTVDFHDQWYADASLGYRWRSGLMVELWTRYGRNGIAEGSDFHEVQATAGTLNIMPCVLYEHDTYFTIDPFAGACIGLGYAGLDRKHFDAMPGNVNVADVGWAWGLRGGLAADLTDDGRYRVRVQYAYVCNEGISWTGVDHMDHLCTHGAGAQIVAGF